MKATFLDEQGKEQRHGNGLLRHRRDAHRRRRHRAEPRRARHRLPEPIAPFQVGDRADRLSARATRSAKRPTSCTRELQAAGIDVLLDDRDERPGVMFADMELIGIPHRVVIGERGLKEGRVEYQGRSDLRRRSVPAADAAPSSSRGCARVLTLAVASAWLRRLAAFAGAQHIRAAVGERAGRRCRARSATAARRSSASRLRRRQPTGCRRCPPSGQAHPGREIPHRASEDGALRGDPRRARSAAGARADPGRERLQASTPSRRPARADSCR